MEMVLFLMIAGAPAGRTANSWEGEGELGAAVALLSVRRGVTGSAMVALSVACVLWCMVKGPIWR